jgi:hypothetical protein
MQFYLIGIKLVDRGDLSGIWDKEAGSRQVEKEH